MITGTLLRVHRRCDQPMFDISNQVAYDDMMVFGTPVRPPVNFPHSVWFHVVSNEADGHWIPAEGAVVKQLIIELLQNGLSHE